MKNIFIGISCLHYFTITLHFIIVTMPTQKLKKKTIKKNNYMYNIEMNIIELKKH